MKTPLLLLTYGMTQKLCTWEEDGIIKLPIFSEAVLAYEFVKSFKKYFKQLMQDKEELQIQVCANPAHATDMLKMVGIIQPLATIIYNPSPMGLDPEESISKMANQFNDIATVINKQYTLAEAVDELDNFIQQNNQP